MTYKFFLWIGLLSFMLTGCRVFAPPPPTPLPSFTPAPQMPTRPPKTKTPAPTFPLNVGASATPTPFVEETPPPTCQLGETVISPPNGSLPGQIDILSAETKMSGGKLFVTLTMNWLPDQLVINRDVLDYGATEIAWGVAIDVDNNPETGGAIPLIHSGYGYEYILQAANFKEGEEEQGALQTLFQDKVRLWEAAADQSFSILRQGKFKADTASASITLSADVKGIKKDSYFHFFATYFPHASQQMTDQVCSR
ncbi:MAG: hypothetical protein LC099_02255 [Anaerolineales bacterium]|nr:hypothetical protein [Anaerolineales bacterium]